jgi:glycosyltransferase involved in cell wall biosynthesis
MSGLVSIIIPVYNAEKYIAETIKSVLAQTYTNWELIIINDGSTDNSERVIKQFLVDERIKYYPQKNTGVSVARNNGMAKSKGDFIAFLDADDGMENRNIEKKLNVFDNNKDIDWVFSDMYNADENLNVIGIAPTGTDIDILNSILLWEKEVVPGPCSNVIIRRKCFVQGVCFDANLSTAADQDLCIQLASKYKGRRIAEPLFIYRILPGSMSRSIAKMQKDHIYVYKKAAINKMFYSWFFERKCFSYLYMNLGGSWWVNGNNKLKAIYFGILAGINYPPSIFKMIRKLYK